MEKNYIASKTEYFVGITVGILLLILAIGLLLSAHYIVFLIPLLFGIIFSLGSLSVIFKGKHLNINTEGILFTEFGDTRIRWKDISSLRVANHHKISFITFSVTPESNYKRPSPFPNDVVKKANLLDFTIAFGGFHKAKDEIIEVILTLYAANKSNI
jgi:hypothetical protein